MQVNERKMKTKPRKMRTYTPRKRRSNKEILKQQMHDLEHLLSMDLSCFVVLSRGGSKKQKTNAHIRLKNDIKKYSPDLKDLGSEFGRNVQDIVDLYLKNMTQIAQHKDDKVDAILFNNHLNYSRMLKKEAA